MCMKRILDTEHLTVDVGEYCHEEVMRFTVFHNGHFVKEYFLPLSDNTEVVAEEDIIQRWHSCRYCGQMVFNREDDMLCCDCQEMFGHTFYSEL